MKTKFAAFIFAAVGLLGIALAQEPTVTSSNQEPSPAAPAPTPSRMVYAPRLPTPVELTKIAAAHGQTIDRIDETPSEVTVTTRTADGHVTTVAYRLLASAGNWSAAAPASNQVPTTSTVVVHHDSPDVVYYPSYGYYGYPYYWGAGYYAPVAVSIGFGWGYYGGYYGYHGHGGYYCAPYYGHGGHGGYYGGGHHH